MIHLNSDVYFSWKQYPNCPLSNHHLRQ